MAFVLSAFSKNPWRTCICPECAAPVIYHINESPLIKCPVDGTIIEMPKERTDELQPQDRPDQLRSNVAG